jgi:hypothetical protein
MLEYEGRDFYNLVVELSFQPFEEVHLTRVCETTSSPNQFSQLELRSHLALGLM